MNNASDFVIENGVLKKYVGPGGNVVIPEGIETIDDQAFFYNSAITSILVPGCVIGIGYGAFMGCDELTDVVISDGVEVIEACAFEGCKKLKYISMSKAQFEEFDRYTAPSLNMVILVRDKAEISFFAYAAKSNKSDSIADFVKRDAWDEYDAELIHNGPRYRYSMEGRLLGSLSRMREIEAPVSVKQEMKNLLIRNAEKLVDSADRLRCPQIIHIMFEQGVVTNKNEAKVRAKLASFQNEQLSQLSTLPLVQSNTQDETHTEVSLKTDSSISEKHTKEKSNSAVSQKLLELLTEKKWNEKDVKEKFKTFYNIPASQLPSLEDKEGAKVDPIVLMALLIAHEKMERNVFGQMDVVAAYKKPGVCPEAAAVVAEINTESLQNGLRYLAKHNLGLRGRSKKMLLAYPICRYADEDVMAELTKLAPSWQSHYGAGNNAPPLKVFREANIYSDTLAAVAFADKYKELNLYAKLRKTTAESLRDRLLSDTGLDAEGKKTYNLGNQSVTIRLQKDLTFLVELSGGKFAKTLPKKGADEEKYATANADFAEIKKVVKKLSKTRSALLFEDYLCNRSRTARDWQNAYLNNPVLRTVAELLVWEQDGKTFTVAGSSLVSANEAVYSLGNKPIYLAHPMEMTAADVTAWQKYFIEHNLKQPFEQIWEPVVDFEAVTEDRYNGIEIPAYRFKGQEKHGITFEFDFGSSYLDIGLNDCWLEYDSGTAVGRHDLNLQGNLVLGKFRAEKSRAANHIIGLLDKWTIYNRILTDDVFVIQLLHNATLAQIADYLRVATENDCTNVTAALLDYKNRTFGDFDPMDEFILGL